MNPFSRIFARRNRALRAGAIRSVLCDPPRPRRLVILAAGVLSALLSLAAAYGQPYVAVNAYPNLTFQDPTCFVSLPGTNRIYVGEREGQIWFFDNDPNTTAATLFLDLSAVTQGFSDSGLLGFAFHPQFGQAGSPNRGYVYVYYSYTPGPIIGTFSSPPNNLTTASYNRLSRFTVPDGSSTVDPNSEVVLINQFDRDTWHNGGGMFFGPDGYLYLTNGDEGSLGDAYHQTQKINSGLFSGVLRIDVDENPATSHPIRRQPQSGVPPPAGWPASYTQNYYIPNDNPWLDPNGGVLEEFYAIGLRSPHRMTYDAQSGQVWIGDVGQNLYEELDLLQKGANYQWSYMEGPVAGPQPRPSVIIGTDAPPYYSYSHSYGDQCVIGGYIYRGTTYAADLGGKYIFGDYVSNHVWSMQYNPSGPPTVTLIAALPPGANYTGGISTFGIDQNGEVYICTMGLAGHIWKLAPASSAPSRLVDLSARATAGLSSQTLIAGFVLGGSGQDQLLVRGVGPALANFGVPSPLPDPEVQLMSGNTVLAQNIGWSTSSNATAISSASLAAGAFALPDPSADSAVLTSLNPGAYTAEVTSVSGATGAALAEIYDTSPSAASYPVQLANLSARAEVGTAPGSFIAGFVIQGGVNMNLLIRGDGPALTGQGVTGALSNVQIALYDANGTLIAQNTGWSSASNASQIAAAAQTLGAFSLASGSGDSAMLVGLAPGAYTVEISGVGSATGVALAEIYAVP